MTTYMIHPEHGTHVVYGEVALAEHLKLGWIVRPDDWAEQELAKAREVKKAELQAQLDRMNERTEKPKRKYTRKTA